MADATPAPREPNRSRPEPPEVTLARAMVATEYGLSAAHRSRAEGPTLAERLVEMVRDGWAVVMEALGASRSRRVGQPPPSPGRTAADLPGGPPQWGPAAAPAPSAPARSAPPAGPEEAAFQEMSRLQALTKQLPPRRYEAFEDAVLHLVRADDRLGKVYEESPESIPAIARYAANAQTRELLREGDGDRAGAERTDPEVRAARERTARERFERPAPPPVPAQEQQGQRGQQEQWQEVSPEPPEESRLRDVGDGPGRFYDAHAFAAAEEAERAKREETPGREVPATTDASRLWSVGGELVHEALPFAVAAEEQRAWREQSSERDDRERRDGRETPASPSDPQRPASPEPVSPLSPASPVGSPGLGLPAGTDRPTGPVSPVVAEPPRALLGDRGLRAARDGFEARDGQPPRRTADSPSAATVHRPAPARTAKGPTR